MPGPRSTPSSPATPFTSAAACTSTDSPPHEPSEWVLATRMRLATRMDLWHSDRCRGTRTGAVSLRHGMFGAEESPGAVVGVGPAAEGPRAAVDRKVSAGDV